VSQQSALGELADAFIEALFLGVRDHRVQIGHQPGLRPEDSHGIIHATNAQGRTEHISFLADKPKKLRRPHPESISHLFTQAKLLGFIPKQIELRVGNIRRVYEEGRSDPVFEQRLS
jgi:hypothetical protein